MVVGDADNPPSRREIFDLLSKPSNNVAVNMVGLKTDERPDYFAKLLPELAGCAIAPAGRIGLSSTRRII